MLGSSRIISLTKRAKAIWTSLLVFWMSCHSMHGFAQVFSGKLDNLSDKQLIVLHPRYDGVYLQSDTILADEQGRFRAMLHLEKPAYIRLRGSGFRNESIYFVPGSDLHITADCTDAASFAETQYFVGKSAVYNHAKQFIAKWEAEHGLELSIQTYQQEKNTFINSTNQLYARKDSLTKSYMAHMPPSQELLDFMMIDSINRAYDLVHIRRSYLQFLPKEEQEPFYQRHIAPFAQHVDNDGWHHFAAPQYRWFFATHIRKLFDDKNNGRQMEGLEPLDYRAYYDFAPQLIHDHLSDRRLRSYVAHTLLETISLGYPYQPDSLTSQYDTWITSLYQKLQIPEREYTYRQLFSTINLFRDAIKPGQPAFGFTVQDPNGQQRSLKDFSGKMLYIDLWASWCAPCIAEFPHLGELEKRYRHRSDIAFLSISLDDLESDWVRGMTQYDPPGEQYWAGGFMSGTMAGPYKINSIPHYLLIDAQGNFVQYKTLRPSDSDLPRLLDSLLSKHGQNE